MASRFQNMFRSPRKINIPPVAVLGLGRFGTSLAHELIDHGVEVLGVDPNPRQVQDMAETLTQAVVADTTDPQALRQLGIAEFDRVVVGIGTNLETSILTAANVVDLNVREVWAKADSDSHARILRKIGVTQVVRPEFDTGKRVAHLLGGRIQDYAAFAKTYAMVKLAPPAFMVGKPLDNQALWKQHHVHVVACYSPQHGWQPMTDGAVAKPDDVLLIGGDPNDLELIGEL